MPARLINTQLISPSWALAAAVPTALWCVDAIRVRRRLADAHRALDGTRITALTPLPARSTYQQAAAKFLRRWKGQAVTVVCRVTTAADAREAVLAATEERLRTWAGPHGLAGRVRDGSFTACIRTVNFRDLRLAQLHQELNEPVLVDGRLLEVTARVGAASPLDLGTGDPDVLQQEAAAALDLPDRDSDRSYQYALPPASAEADAHHALSAAHR